VPSRTSRASLPVTGATTRVDSSQSGAESQAGITPSPERIEHGTRTTAGARLAARTRPVPRARGGSPLQPARRPLLPALRHPPACGLPGHAAIVGPTGYCHWHDPALGVMRQAWCEGRRGPRDLRWWMKVAKPTGHAPSLQWETHPDFPAPLPPLDLAGVTPDQRRAVIALLSSPTAPTPRRPARWGSMWAACTGISGDSGPHSPRCTPL
jgi:hypothetical protein